LAKDRTPANRGKGGPARGGSSSAGKGSPAGKGATARGGRTRPPTQVVTQNRRPWGLIIAAVAVVVFAVSAIGYALVQVNRAEANAIESPDEIEGIETYEYEAGQHVATPVEYSESPPVGGEHAGVPEWADCTGTVYDVDIRHENAVHSLEHGAVWVTYNPDEVSDADIDTLAQLVDGESGRMLSPYVGLDSPISVQSWNHQLKVDSATDPRLEQYADFFTLNPEFHPEPGASCENPAWLTSPVLEESDGQVPAETTAPAESTAPSSSAPASETPAQ
jgi:hypothetical protein